MADFQTGAELEISVSQSSLSDARDTIESELGDLEVDVNAVISGNRSQPRDPGSGQFMAMEGVEQRVVNTNEILSDIRSVLFNVEDDLGAGGVVAGGGGEGGPGGFIGKIIGGVGSGGGKAVGGGIGGGIGTSALGIGAGVGIGALGLGAGAGLATGNLQLPEKFNIELGEDAISMGTIEPVINGPFVSGPVADVAFEPTLNPVFNPEFNPDFSPRFDPEFNPNFDIENTIDASPELSANINFSPSLSISNTVNFTGIDLSGLSVDLADEVITSRQFQRELDTAIDQAVDDLEDRIADTFG